MCKSPECYKPWCGMDGKYCVDCATYTPTEPTPEPNIEIISQKTTKQMFDSDIDLLNRISLLESQNLNLNKQIKDLSHAFTLIQTHMQPMGTPPPGGSEAAALWIVQTHKRAYELMAVFMDDHISQDISLESVSLMGIIECDAWGIIESYRARLRDRVGIPISVPVENENRSVPSGQ